MKANVMLGVVSVTALLAACGQQNVTPQSTFQGQGAATAARYVIVYKNQSIPVTPLAAGGTQVKLLHAVPSIGVASANLTAAQADALRSDPAVAEVGLEHAYRLPPDRLIQADSTVEQAPTPGVNTVTPADSLWGYQWDMRRIGAPAAWQNVSPAQQASVTVAVIDTGVADNHPDLVNNVSYRKSTNYCPEVNGPTSSPAYPKYDFVIDLDAATLACAPLPAPVYESHGTHVSGTIAAQFGGGRVVGVAPFTKIAAYKVFDILRYKDANGVEQEGAQAFDTPIFQAITDAADHGFQVINMSLGGTLDKSNRDEHASLTAWKRTLAYARAKGVTIVTSAGNDARHLAGNVVDVPGDLPEALDVSATGSSQVVFQNGLFDAVPGSDVLAFYSNYGPSVDIAAPGGDLGPDGTADPRPYLILNDGIIEDGPTAGSLAYYFMAGTSMAAPHVAGAAALVKAQHPNFTPQQVKSWLSGTADRIGQPDNFGAGIVNVARATQGQ
ncbi:MAG TPA: S8 family serine peptidase [Deinococcales bacterium]|nr:S8 family serine peptidase [Deinococcales bacterium]